MNSMHRVRNVDVLGHVRPQSRALAFARWSRNRRVCGARVSRARGSSRCYAVAPHIRAIAQGQLQDAPSHAQKPSAYVQLSGVEQVEPALGLLSGQALGLHCHDVPTQVQVLSV